MPNNLLGDPAWSVAKQNPKFAEEVLKPSQHLQELGGPAEIEVQVATNLLGDPAWSVAKQNPKFAEEVLKPSQHLQGVGWTCQPGAGCHQSTGTPAG